MLPFRLWWVTIGDCILWLFTCIVGLKFSSQKVTENILAVSLNCFVYIRVQIKWRFWLFIMLDNPKKIIRTQITFIFRVGWNNGCQYTFKKWDIFNVCENNNTYSGYKVLSIFSKLETFEMQEKIVRRLKVSIFLKC